MAMSSEARPLFLGDAVPDFEAHTQMGEIRFHEYTAGSWCVLFSHPANFTPVCTTEIAQVARMKHEFETRNTKVLGMSMDSIESHRQFIDEINESQDVSVNFPIIADPELVVANKVGMISTTAASARDGMMSARWLYIVDPEKKLQLAFTYPAATGRNFNEVLRCLDSLQLTAQLDVGTPANWQKGEDVVILPSVDDEQASKLFPQGFTAIKPYLRITPHPDVKGGAAALEDKASVGTSEADEGKE